MEMKLQTVLLALLSYYCLAAVPRAPDLPVSFYTDVSSSSCLAFPKCWITSVTVRVVFYSVYIYAVLYGGAQRIDGRIQSRQRWIAIVKLSTLCKSDQSHAYFHLPLSNRLPRRG